MHIRTLRDLPAVFAFAVALVCPIHGQQCPHTNKDGVSIQSQSRTLEGRLIFHDGIRKWFELKLDRPECGQHSIELVPNGEDWTPIQVSRGCKVRSTGSLDFTVTGYYMLAVAQAVTAIAPAEKCIKQPPFPDFSKTTPDKAVEQYRVDMTVDTETGDHPIVFRITSAGRELHPWQAYASYSLTSGQVLYGYCGSGFLVDKVFGTPEASPSHFNDRGSPEDAAEFDPESAASVGKKIQHLGYTCARKL